MDIWAGLLTAAAVTLAGCAAPAETVPERELAFTVPAGLEGVAGEAMAEWNATCGYHFRAAPAGFRIEWAANVGTAEELGKTSLEEQVIRLDASKLADWDRDALVQIVAHEMGHAQGWLHTEDPRDLMYRNIFRGEARRHVAPSDCYY